jgi:hypothetical protein
MLNDYGKLYLLGLSMILGTLVGTVLIVVGEVAAGVGIVSGTVGTTVGYLTGNGALATRAEAPSPVFVPPTDALMEKAINDLEDAQHDA